MLRVLRPVLICLLVMSPAVALRVAGVDLPAPARCWSSAPGWWPLVRAGLGGRGREVDISGGLAVALLAVIAVLPEYAVDLYFAYRAGEDPAYVQYAAANMTGSNRLLLGLGWSVVVLISVYVVGRRSGTPVRTLVLNPRYRLELGFLLLASIVALIIPLTGEIHLVLGIVLLALLRLLSGPGRAQRQR